MSKSKNISYEEFLLKFKKVIKKNGLNNTYHRDIILKVLFECDVHLKAEDIKVKAKEKFGVNIGIATIYRTLNLLENMNIINSISIDDQSGKIYELAIQSHHDHLVCTQCNKIVEFYNKELEELQENVANRHKFKLLNHNMILYGICKECQNAK